MSGRRPACAWPGRSLRSWPGTSAPGCCTPPVTPRSGCRCCGCHASWIRSLSEPQAWEEHKPGTWGEGEYDAFPAEGARRGTRMLIAILNQSTLVTDADAAAMTQASRHPGADGCRPAVGPLPRGGRVLHRHRPPCRQTAHGIAIVDTIQNQPPGVLGFHTEDQGGKLWGVVAAKPELDNGGPGDHRRLERVQRAVPRGAGDVRRPELQPVGQRRQGVGLTVRGVRPG